MPRQSNGNYLPPANTAAVSGAAVSSAAFNTLETDIGTEITNSLDRQGRSAMQAALPMGGNKITGMADPTGAADAATKAYIDAAIAAFFSTGDVKPTLKTVGDAGWLMMNDGTVGNAGAGSTYASASYLALYTLLWTNVSSPSSNAWCAVTGGLGAPAAADWAGLKPLALPKALGRALAGSGAGAGLTSRALGAALGLETTTLSAGNVPTITAVNAAQSITVGLPNGTARFAYSNNGDLTAFSAAGSGGFVSEYSPSNSWLLANGMTSNNSISATYTNGSPTAFNIVQPSLFVNFMIKY